MKKIILFLIFVLVIIVGAYFIFRSGPETEENPLEEENQEQAVFDPMNCAYLIDNKEVVLKDGLLEEEILPDSASKIITKYLGNETIGDFDGNGTEDAAFVLTQETGGSGTFYYLVAALRTEEGCQGTNAVLLGDRIAPQTNDFENNKIVVTYLDREEDEPMSAEPTVAVSKYFQVEGGSLVEAEAPAESEE